MRHNTALCPSLSATEISHSSLAQTSSRHHSPEALHGPDACTILPRTRQADVGPPALIRDGNPYIVTTFATNGGRKILKPITHCGLRIADCGFDFDLLRIPVKRFIRKASGRWVSRSSGEPTLSTPTSFAKRAKVSSSFSGSGDSG